MRFVIVTGMSGAGKSSALKMLEDMEYFCVDNLPVPLIDKFVQLLLEGSSGEIEKVAVGVDIRSGRSLGTLKMDLEKVKGSGI
ncbi:ATPase, P-loop-containing, partial [gut metagenome]